MMEHKNRRIHMYEHTITKYVYLVCSYQTSIQMRGEKKNIKSTVRLEHLKVHAIPNKRAITALKKIETIYP